MKRYASANWKGTGKEGKGTTSTQSGVLKDTQYSFNSRFADGIGTNPEELVAAAHADCYTMKLSFVLNEAGFTADNIDTKCTITLENGSITSSHLEVKATVPGIDAAKFEACAADAKANCPISKLLNTNIFDGGFAGLINNSINIKISRAGLGAGLDDDRSSR